MSVSGSREVGELNTRKQEGHQSADQAYRMSKTCTGQHSLPGTAVTQMYLIIA